MTGADKIVWQWDHFGNNNNIPSEITQVKIEEGRGNKHYNYLMEEEKLFPKYPQLKCSKCKYKGKKNSSAENIVTNKGNSAKSRRKKRKQKKIVL